MLLKWLKDVKGKKRIIEISREDITENTIIGFVVDYNNIISLIKKCKN